MPMWSIWLILSGVFFILETFTVSFLLFWPGVGAFVAFILAIIGIENLTIQIAAFCITSIILIVFMKPILQKFVKTTDHPTNVNSIIGKRGNVLKPIDNVKGSGQVKIAGEVWTAIYETDEIIPIDTIVEVVSVIGVKVKVKKV